MSEIEKIKRYIDKTKLTPEAIGRYYPTWGDIDALYSSATQDANRAISALVLAFNYGMAKGYRVAKAEQRTSANTR